MSKTKTNKIKFDELNALDIYYSPMQIDIGSKTRRRELAELLTDAFLFFFSAYEVHKEFGRIQPKQYYEQLLANRISESVTKVTGIDSYMSDHIRQMSKEVVNTTFERTSRSYQESTPLEERYSPEPPDAPLTSGGSLSPRNYGIGETNDDYWLSYKRAEDIAKSEANTFLNYTDYVDAKDLGKTKKRWLTMLDDKVRQTHSEVEGETIGIDEVFHVGDSLMRFPHDLAESPDPKEVIGCRCAIEYL